MAYLCHSGMFLIDRRMHITRVHMRFPVGPRRPPVGMLAARDPPAWVAKFKTGSLTVPAKLDPAQLALHHMTLVEGEMVIDELPGGGHERAFYIYDLMMILGVLVTDLPWKVRAASPPDLSRGALARLRMTRSVSCACVSGMRPHVAATWCEGRLQVERGRCT